MGVQQVPGRGRGFNTPGALDGTQSLSARLTRHSNSCIMLRVLKRHSGLNILFLILPR